jgi:hypothetical protein
MFGGLALLEPSGSGLGMSGVLRFRSDHFI